MASRTIRVQFLPDTVANEVVADPEVHDVSINDDVAGAPEVLENPHVDFPGMWRLVEGGPDRTAGVGADTTPDGGPNTAVAAGRSSATDATDGVLRYARYDQVGQTNNVRTD